MAGRVKESVWVERGEWIRKQEQSGLSVAQFCRDNDLIEANFHAWRLRFAKLSGRSCIGAGKASKATDVSRALRAFVQLPLPPVAVPVAVSGPSWIEVSLADGMVVRVPASNLAALEAVLGCLGRSREESRHA